MARSEALKEIVESGADLTIATRINSKLLIELVELSKASGSKLTITTSMSTKIVREIVAERLDNISFIHLKEDR